MDTGDVILHKPTGERWVVAYVRGQDVCCCGWPESLVRRADCDLVISARPEPRLELLQEMSTLHDSRGTFARKRLAAAERILPREY